MATDEKTQTQEYTLRIGSHTWIDGKTYNANDPDNNKMQLTKDQMERIGKERFEVQVDTGASTQAAELAEENKRLREQIAQMQKQAGQSGSEDEGEDENEEEGNDYTDLLSKSVPDIAKHLQSVSDVSELNSIQAQESKDGQPRVGVLKAIEARREELSNT